MNRKTIVKNILKNPLCTSCFYNSQISHSLCPFSQVKNSAFVDPIQKNHILYFKLVSFSSPQIFKITKLQPCAPTTFDNLRYNWYQDIGFSFTFDAIILIE